MDGFIKQWNKFVSHVMLRLDAETIARLQKEELQRVHPEVTICYDCDYAGVAQHLLSGGCWSKAAPVTNVVTGFKSCADINKGKCEYYRHILRKVG